MNMNYLSSALVIVLVASGASLAAPKAKKNEIKDARDKQKYRTVVIDGRKWMADNLNYKMPGSTCYREDDDNCMVYGRLYTWTPRKKLALRVSICQRTKNSKAFGKPPAAITMPVT
jgi:hypothetical protein